MDKELKHIKYKYDVFLSHSSKNKVFVRQLDKKLRAIGIITFFDENDVPWGGNIPTTIEKSIDESKHMIVVITADSLGSEWVDLERCITTFNSPSGRKGSILPLLHKDCDKIPGSLRILKFLSVRNNQEFEIEWPKIVSRLGSDKITSKLIPPTDFSAENIEQSNLSLEIN